MAISPIFVFLPFFIISLFALNPYSRNYLKETPEYPRLSARAIGIGTAMTAVSGDEQCVFYNPAGLAGIRGFRVGQSHSLRHFPGEIRNLDQLDADPVSISAPLRFFGTYCAGFTIQGECGYDYMNRNEMDYPQRKEWGVERFDAYAVNVTPWTKLGVSHRSRIYRKDSDLSGTIYKTQSEGEGGCFGIIQTILPGFDFGYAIEKMDDDYSSGLGLTTKTVRTGWSVKPLPWLHVMWDNEKIKTKFASGETRNIQSNKKKNWGVEFSPLPWITLRTGSINGNKTSGVTLGGGHLKLNYGEAKDMMPEIVGEDYPDRFKDVHLAGWSVEF